MKLHGNGLAATVASRVPRSGVMRTAAESPALRKGEKMQPGTKKRAVLPVDVTVSNPASDTRANGYHYVVEVRDP